MGEALLADHRRRIDDIDAALVGLLAERAGVVREVAAVKHANNIPARLDDRVATVIANVRARAETAGCPPDLAETVWRTIIEWAIAFEERTMSGTTSQEPS